MRTALPLLALLLAACTSSDDDPPASDWYCVELPAAVVDVTGTYHFDGTSPGFPMRGTITFTQAGTTVTCTGTTYENTDDRELEGQGAIVGNRLDITLVPKNGDLDYVAQVTLLFSPDGDEFCCSFSDTNDDTGPLGSYTGVRQ